jgi:hypothetical protein
MPRNKPTSTESWDLNSARNVQALQALLDDDGAEVEHTSSGKAPKQRKEQRRGDHFFKLKDDAGSSPAGPASDPLTALVEAFGVDRAMAADVLGEGGIDGGWQIPIVRAPAVHSRVTKSDCPTLHLLLAGACQGDADTAAQLLLSMGAGQASSAQPPAASAPASHPPQGASTSSAPPAGQLQPRYWDMLPPDVKQLVMELLPVRELARASTACKDFARRASSMRAAVRHLSVPPGVPPPPPPTALHPPACPAHRSPCLPARPTHSIA